MGSDSSPESCESHCWQAMALGTIRVILKLYNWYALSITATGKTDNNSKGMEGYGKGNTFSRYQESFPRVFIKGSL